MTAKKTYKVQIVRDGSMCFIPVPFDPAPVFGKLRAPVKVTLNGYSYASTIASMGNGPCIPLRRSHREAAGLDGNERLAVTLELDTAKREVEPPRDLVKALKAAGATWQRWTELSYTHQREHVEAIEQAKKPETRARRIAAAVTMVSARAPTRSRRARTSSS
ncbi:MAG: YdeI/OmpD-associated family protein [Kofleriaceae bacterium]